MEPQFDGKKFFKINQAMKKFEYFYDFKSKSFIGYDGQSYATVRPKGYNPFEEVKRFILISDGVSFFQFSNANRKPDFIINGNNVKFNVIDKETKVGEFTEDIPNLVQDFYVPKENSYPVKLSSKAITYDASKSSIFIDEDIVSEEGIPTDINLVIDLLSAKRKVTGNDFVFLEIIEGDLHFKSRRIDISWEHPSLICNELFYKLETKAKDLKTKYFNISVDDKIICFNYGNCEVDYSYQFRLFQI